MLQVIFEVPRHERLRGGALQDADAKCSGLLSCALSSAYQKRTSPQAGSSALPVW